VKVKTIWVLQVLLAVAFGVAGAATLSGDRQALVANGMAWAPDFSDAQVTLIGVAEVAGVIGLIVPAAAGIVPVLTPVAAAALAVLMGGAVMTHAQRGESVVPAAILAVLSAAVAAARWMAQRRTRR